LARKLIRVPEGVRELIRGKRSPYRARIDPGGGGSGTGAEMGMFWEARLGLFIGTSFRYEMGDYWGG